MRLSRSDKKGDCHQAGDKSRRRQARSSLHSSQHWTKTLRVVLQQKLTSSARF